MSKPYLLVFNLASMVGWAMILSTTVRAAMAGLSAADLWLAVGGLLRVTQSLAALEVLHALLGLVRSPVFTTLLQVSSRLLLVWVYTNASTVCQHHWSLYLMVGSWALVEVPRYLFYACNLYMSKVPAPLFFIRYHAFMVLYPSGISGELLQMYTALSSPVMTTVAWRLTVSLILIELRGGPFMIRQMNSQRQRAYARRNQASGPKKAPSGLLFPLDAKGTRSTTDAGKRIFSESVAAVSQDAAQAVLKERNWRFGYAKHVVANVEASLASPDAALQVARAGLDTAMQSFEFVRDGESMSLADAMANITTSFHTGVVTGSKPRPAAAAKPLAIPYKGGVLTGDDLVAQLTKWATYGTIEPSARDAIAMVAAHPEWLDLSDQYFVLLGAGSAMGPLLTLLDLGANIIAVDLDRPGIWQRLIGLARDSSGTMTFPLRVEQSACATDDDLFAAAGCNLFTQTPEIANWVSGVCPGQRLAIGGYAYLDGALHVQVSLAMVAVMQGVMKKRSDVSLAFLCSPTDVFVSPDDAVAAVAANAAAVPLWQRLVKALSMGKVLRPNTRKPVNGMTVVNGIVVPQGPNYALAKRLQHWLAILARADGHTVSSNIAPSTATVSVVHNAQFAAAYGGFHHFKPMEVFYQETSNAVMCALLIHDVRNTKGVAQPTTRLTNPLQLFTSGAFHGGIWRNAFTIGSIGEVAATAFYLKTYALHMLGTVAWGVWVSGTVV